MGDPSVHSDYLFDQGFLMRQDIGMEQMSTTASVPIPARRLEDFLFDSSFEFNPDYSPSTSQDHLGDFPAISGMPANEILWNNIDHFPESIIMDEDISQTDRPLTAQDPTLNELNANDLEDLLTPYGEEMPTMTMGQNDVAMPILQVTDNHTAPQPHLLVNSNFTPATFPPAGFGFPKDNFNSAVSVPSSPFELYLPGAAASALSPSNHSHHSSSSSILQPPRESTPPSTSVSPLQMKHSALHELLLRDSCSTPERLHTLLGKSVPGPSSPAMSALSPTSPRVTHTRSRLSSSAPTHLGLEQIWQRREPRKHLLSTGSLAEAGSTSSISTGVVSPESRDYSQDEGSDSEDDSDHYEYDAESSDEDSTDGEGDKERTRHSSSKKERYFWQYNVQSKGPKGQRLALRSKLEDPHVLNEVTDPVFSPSCSVRGIKHSGKARKGDGNDLTPNPKKLHSIGKELDGLSKVINGMTPVSELPFNIRPKNRKEKNKLASRACRLKKKAQHEANKIKLFGLEHEHKKLLNGIEQVKQLLVAKVKTDDPAKREEVNKHVEKSVRIATKVKIAGHTTDYVNRVLDKVKVGIPDGGLNDF